MSTVLLKKAAELSLRRLQQAMIQYSIPFLAEIPCSYGCFSQRISVI